MMLDHYKPPPPRGRRWRTPGMLAKALDTNTVQTPALDLIDAELVTLVDDPSVDRLMIFMPPQEGKSSRVSHRFPEWVLDQDRDCRIAIVSYADEMARRWGSAIKRDTQTFGDGSAHDLEIELWEDSKAAGRWEIKGHKGGVYCVGIKGSLTGKPVDLMIIDDPVKDLQAAQSVANRKAAREFWQAVAIPRLAPGAKVVVIQTRWHEDDLAGWLLKNEPGRWRVISIPAMAGKQVEVARADETRATEWVEDGLDPLGRAPGVPMDSARGQRDWDAIREGVGDYVWSALYQQKPTPSTGGLFKRASLRYWRWAPTNAMIHDVMGGLRIDLGGRVRPVGEFWRFLTVDLAASTRTSADETCVGVWGIGVDGDLVLLDGASDRVEEGGHWELARPLWERWVADTVFVESRMFGTTMVIQATREGVPVSELKAEQDKFTRAIPASVRAKQGRIWLPAVDSATLNVRSVVDQLIQFPNATHDDWVDVVSYAARVVIAHWAGFSQQMERPSPPPDDDDTFLAWAAQTGIGAIPDIDQLRW